LDMSKHTHTPQSIPPHPVLAMLASNHLVRLGVLIILYTGALYYFVTVMEHQIVGDAMNIAASNWWGDSNTTAGTRSPSLESADTGNRRRVHSSATATTMSTATTRSSGGLENEQCGPWEP
jgi:hypothetical protein